MAQLFLNQPIPHPIKYFGGAFFSSLITRLYVVFVEIWANKKWNWKSFRDILIGHGIVNNENKIVAADRTTGFIIGFLECLAYSLFIKIGKPDYIGAWLIFKTVNRWKYKEQDRGLFNRYLVANGFVLVASYLLAQFGLS